MNTTFEIGKAYELKNGKIGFYGGIYDGNLRGFKCSECGKAFRSSAHYFFETSEQTGEVYMVGKSCVKAIKEVQ